jgi:Tol biopolymer transport system component
MKTNRLRDILLTLFGILALAIYVLACRPSFSPDGSRVVYTVMDKNQTRVMLYDIRDKHSETLFVASNPSKSEPLAYEAQWLPNGRQVLINGESSIMILPIGSSKPARLIELNDEVTEESLVFPMPVVDNNQFLANKSDIARVNLETGETLKVTVQDKKNFFLLKGPGSQVFYVVLGEDNEKSKALEIGRLDTDTLGCTPLIELKPQEGQKFSPFLSAARDGNRLALIGHYQDAFQILIYRGLALEKTLSVATKESGINLGNTEWSSDEKTIYAAFSRKLDDGDEAQFGVLAVPVNGDTVHETVLFTGKEERGDDGVSMFQIALSPDGRRIAATSALHNREDQALYLIDVSNAKWEVTKIPAPLTSNAESAAKKK